MNPGKRNLILAAILLFSTTLLWAQPFSTYLKKGDYCFLNDTRDNKRCYRSILIGEVSAKTVFIMSKNENFDTGEIIVFGVNLELDRDGTPIYSEYYSSDKSKEDEVLASIEDIRRWLIISSKMTSYKEPNLSFPYTSDNIEYIGHFINTLPAFGIFEIKEKRTGKIQISLDRFGNLAESEFKQLNLMKPILKSKIINIRSGKISKSKMKKRTLTHNTIRLDSNWRQSKQNNKHIYSLVKDNATIAVLFEEIYKKSDMRKKQIKSLHDLVKWHTSNIPNGYGFTYFVITTENGGYLMRVEMYDKNNHKKIVLAQFFEKDDHYIIAQLTSSEAAFHKNQNYFKKIFTSFRIN